MDAKIVEIKETILELILNISRRIDDISDSYKSSGVIENDRLVNLLEDLQALAEGIDIIKDYYPGIDLFEFREKLDMMTKALGDQDLLLFDDIVKYELKDLLTYWETCLNK